MKDFIPPLSRLGCHQPIEILASLSRKMSGLRGRGFIGQYLGHRLNNRSQRDWLIPMRLGHEMIAPAGSTQSWQAAFTGEYDLEVVQFLSQYIDSRNVILDIGASIGFYAIPLGVFASKADAQLIAIEPVPRNCEYLRRNIERNGLGEVITLLPLGLASVSGTVDMHVEGSGAGNAAVVAGIVDGSLSRHDDAGNLRTTTTVRLERLDDLTLPMVADQRCSLVKIDVEGYELDVLQGAETFIEANRPVIFGEFNPQWLASRGLSSDSPFLWAAEHGYSIMAVQVERLSRISDRRTVRILPCTSSNSSSIGLLLIPE